MVSTKTAVGSIGLLANHQPLLAMLDPTELRLYKSESDVVRYAQGEGFLQIAGEHALVLVDEVFEVDELNRSDLQDRIKRAEQERDRADEEGERRGTSSLAWQAKWFSLRGLSSGIVAAARSPSWRASSSPRRRSPCSPR